MNERVLFSDFCCAVLFPGEQLLLPGQDCCAFLLRVSRFQWQSLQERVEMSAKTASFVGEGSDLLLIQHKFSVAQLLDSQVINPLVEWERC
jgi:hypothetical protein